MCELLETELPVGLIAQKVGLSQSALSQHLSRLRNLRLVNTRRDKQTIYYSCTSEQVRRLFGTLDAIFVASDAEQVVTA
jgi:DNA-binding transcriptional ArsR family regulator